MSKYCNFQLQRTLGINVNEYRCRTCEEQISVRSAFPPIRECVAKRSCLVIPDELQQYVAAALRYPKPHRIENDVYYFRLKPGNRMLQVPLAALDAEYLEWIKEREFAN